MSKRKEIQQEIDSLRRQLTRDLARLSYDEVVTIESRIETLEDDLKRLGQAA